MALGNSVEISRTESTSVSTETRQHPLSEESTVFSMQMRFVSTKTVTTVREIRGLPEIDPNVYTSSATTTDENNYSTKSYSWTKLGEFCIYTVTETETEVTITRSGWFNISGD